VKVHALRSRGSIFVELLTILLLLTAVASIVTPRIRETGERRRALVLYRQVDSLRSAALAHRSIVGEWPPPAPEGEIPLGLGPLLPPDFAMTGEGYALTWEHWYLPNGLPRHPGPRTLVGVTLRVEESGLTRHLTRTLGADLPRFSQAGRETFLLEGL